MRMQNYVTYNIVGQGTSLLCRNNEGRSEHAAEHGEIDDCAREEGEGIEVARVPEPVSKPPGRFRTYNASENSSARHNSMRRQISFPFKNERSVLPFQCTAVSNWSPRSVSQSSNP